ncbi:hypothetical protein CYMTET_29594 [Cymbomonas tetramitiformis]|uniref:Uncharacterized protein n=1 Tax=Cymbomonas tetramitiformis TaxID=36881 RepID=A0AAE0KUS9_9CHLO|nr:hypothetical protein CYMTET_29594 [Cymbomonas tetramitiformis]
MQPMAMLSMCTCPRRWDKYCTASSEAAQAGSKALYWLEDEKDGFVAAAVSSDPSTASGSIDVEVGMKVGNDIVLGSAGKKQTRSVDPKKLTRSSSLIPARMPEFWVLHLDLAQDQIYTWIGTILVAINPFKMVPLYSPDKLNDVKCKDATSGDVEPHTYAIADAAYQQMISKHKSQSILVSGESGAGKTESTKQVLCYLGQRAGSVDNIEQKMLLANPILEAFGNAKTLRNNNSSRFGKWVSIQFSSRGNIKGVKTTNYLLEKSRIFHQAQQERNYHVFYQLCACDDAALNWYTLVVGLEGEAGRGTLMGQEELSAVTRRQYRLLNKSGCIFLDDTDDAAEFSALRTAMQKVGFAPEEVKSVLKIVAAILHLGNVTFEANGDNSKVANPDVVNTAAGLLSVTQEALMRCLSQRTIRGGGNARGSVTTILYKPHEAAEATNSLMADLYSRLFDWLVGRINLTTACEDDSGCSIGILDIFGFEIFDKNSLEQLCINYTNEKLQQLFNQETFKLEEEIYKSEGIDFEHVNYIDNQPVVDLVDKKPDGIMVLLDEEVIVPRGSDGNFLDKLTERHQKNDLLTTEWQQLKRNRKPTDADFTVSHYAGPVVYNSNGWLEKNKDALSFDLVELIASSEDAVNASLYPQSAQQTRAKKVTLGSKFRQQLTNLITALKETELHFIRCIKPNPSKKAGEFDGAMVLEQLQYSGVFEAVAIRRSGYPFRYKHGDFVRQYSKAMAMLGGVDPSSAEGSAVITSSQAAIRRMNSFKFKGSTPEEQVTESLAAASLDSSQFKMGQSMVLFQAEQHRSMDLLRTLSLMPIACVLQAGVRGWMDRCLVRAIREARTRLVRALTVKSNLELTAAALDHAGTLLYELRRTCIPRLELQQAQALFLLLQERKQLHELLQSLLKEEPVANFERTDLVAQLVAGMERCEAIKEHPGTEEQLAEVKRAGDVLAQVQERVQARDTLLSTTSALDEDAIKAAVSCAEKLKMSEKVEALVGARAQLERFVQERAISAQMTAALSTGGQTKVATKYGKMELAVVKIDELAKATEAAAAFVCFTKSIMELEGVACATLALRKALTAPSFGDGVSYTEVETVVAQAKAADAGDGEEFVAAATAVEARKAVEEVHNKLPASIAEVGLEGLQWGLARAETLEMEPEAMLKTAKELVSAIDEWTAALAASRAVAAGLPSAEELERLAKFDRNGYKDKRAAIADLVTGIKASVAAADKIGAGYKEGSAQAAAMLTEWEAIAASGDAMFKNVEAVHVLFDKLKEGRGKMASVDTLKGAARSDEAQFTSLREHLVELSTLAEEAVSLAKSMGDVPFDADVTSSEQLLGTLQDAVKQGDATLEAVHRVYALLAALDAVKAQGVATAAELKQAACFTPEEYDAKVMVLQGAADQVLEMVPKAEELGEGAYSERVRQMAAWQAEGAASLVAGAAVRAKVDQLVGLLAKVAEAEADAPTPDAIDDAAKYNEEVYEELQAKLKATIALVDETTSLSTDLGDSRHAPKVASLSELKETCGERAAVGATTREKVLQLQKLLEVIKEKLGSMPTLPEVEACAKACDQAAYDAMRAGIMTLADRIKTEALALVQEIGGFGEDVVADLINACVELAAKGDAMLAQVKALLALLEKVEATVVPSLLELQTAAKQVDKAGYEAMQAGLAALLETTAAAAAIAAEIGEGAYSARMAAAEGSVPSLEDLCSQGAHMLQQVAKLNEMIAAVEAITMPTSEEMEVAAKTLAEPTFEGYLAALEQLGKDIDAAVALCTEIGDGPYSPQMKTMETTLTAKCDAVASGVALRVEVEKLVALLASIKTQEEALPSEWLQHEEAAKMAAEGAFVKEQSGMAAAMRTCAKASALHSKIGQGPYSAEVDAAEGLQAKWEGFCTRGKVLREKVVLLMLRLDDIRDSFALIQGLEAFLNVAKYDVLEYAECVENFNGVQEVVDQCTEMVKDIGAGPYMPELDAAKQRKEELETMKQRGAHVRSETDRIAIQTSEGLTYADVPTLGASIVQASRIALRSTDLSVAAKLLGSKVEDQLQWQLGTARQLGDDPRVKALRINLKEHFYTRCAFKVGLEDFKHARDPEEYAGLKRWILGPLAFVNRKELSEGMFKWADYAIHTSLTKQGSWGDMDFSGYENDARQIFKSIMGYMGDGQVYPYPVTLAFHVMKSGVDMPHLADEIYLQLMKQLTDNPSTESMDKGWELVGLCLRTFPPSLELERILGSFLASYGAAARKYLDLLYDIMEEGPIKADPTVELATEWLQMNHALENTRRHRYSVMGRHEAFRGRNFSVSSQDQEIINQLVATERFNASGDRRTFSIAAQDPKAIASLTQAHKTGTTPRERAASVIHTPVHRAKKWYKANAEGSLASVLEVARHRRELSTSEKLELLAARSEYALFGNVRCIILFASHRVEVARAVAAFYASNHLRGTKIIIVGKGDLPLVNEAQSAWFEMYLKKHVSSGKQEPLTCEFKGAAEWFKDVLIAEGVPPESFAIIKEGGGGGVAQCSLVASQPQTVQEQAVVSLRLMKQYLPGGSGTVVYANFAMHGTVGLKALLEIEPWLQEDMYIVSAFPPASEVKELKEQVDAEFQRSFA